MTKMNAKTLRLKHGYIIDYACVYTNTMHKLHEFWAVREGTEEFIPFHWKLLELTFPHESK